MIVGGNEIHSDEDYEGKVVVVVGTVVDSWPLLGFGS